MSARPARSLAQFAREQAVLLCALAAAVASMLLRPPVPANWRAYAESVDVRTLALLFCLMAVVAGLTRAGLMAKIRARMVRGERTARQISFALVNLSFFSAMVLTNDVALISFVPLALLLLGASSTRAVVTTLTAQTVAANLGSMLTPIGNPQNIYLYSAFGMGLGEFFATIAPFALAGFAASNALCLLVPREAVEAGEAADAVSLNVRLVTVYIVLLCVCLACVGRLISWQLCLVAVFAACLVFDRRVLLEVDYGLLLTFVCFFVFVGNLKSVPAVAGTVQAALGGREILVSALLSQVISNVPAAIMLSGFTDAGGALLVGTNIGGLGTPVASLASLITLRAYAAYPGSRMGSFVRCFLAVNLSLLAASLLLATII